MKKFLSGIKGKVVRKLKGAAGWLAVKLGDQQLADVVDDNAQLQGQLNEALAIIGGMNEAIGLLEHRNKVTTRNGVVAIAALLTVNGGEATINNDTIAACEGATIKIDYVKNEDGVTLKLAELGGGEAEDDDEEDTVVDAEVAPAEEAEKPSDSPANAG